MILIAKIEVHICTSGADIRVRITVFGIIPIRFRFKIMRERNRIFTLYRIKKKEAKPLTSLRKIIRSVRQNPLSDRQKFARKKSFAYVYKHTDIQIRINAALGAGSAYNTAMLCGAVQSIFSALGAVFYKRNHTFVFKTTPDFAAYRLSVRADCIIALSPANIIFGYIIYKRNTRR